MKRFISSFQGLVAGLAALCVYLALPSVIRIYDPTAGVFDAGYLQWVGLATVLTFWTIFIGWVGFQIAFRSIDREADRAIAIWFESLGPREKWYVTQIAFLMTLALFLVCLNLIPL
jgi:hypothetical protein